MKALPLMLCVTMLLLGGSVQRSAVGAVADDRIEGGRFRATRSAVRGSLLRSGSAQRTWGRPGEGATLPPVESDADAGRLALEGEKIRFRSEQLRMEEKDVRENLDVDMETIRRLAAHPSLLSRKDAVKYVLIIGAKLKRFAKVVLAHAQKEAVLSEKETLVADEAFGDQGIAVATSNRVKQIMQTKSQNVAELMTALSGCMQLLEQGSQAHAFSSLELALQKFIDAGRDADNELDDLQMRLAASEGALTYADEEKERQIREKAQ
eukprot:g1895.t1